MEPPVAVPARSWRLARRALPVGPRTLLMGVVNVTPDSFSDGGRFFEPHRAVAHGVALVAEGADLLDVGGESTRPGSRPVPPEEERRRVLPVIEALHARASVPLSVDTRKADVAGAALEAGAEVVNDVSALQDPAMGGVVAAARAGLVLMHMRGQPQTMQRAPTYVDVVHDVRDHLRERATAAQAAGVARGAIVVDPGLGFGKRTGRGIEDNATLLGRLPELAALGYPILVGASRKSFIGNILGLPLEERLEGSLAAAALAAWNGASIIRAHDVRATRRVLDLVDAVRVARADTSE